MRYKYLILGAGPAGLTFANLLKEHKEENFLVLEKEQEAGGLCRSIDVDGAPLDIGGGHFLDVRRPKVNQFLFQFMPEEEWDLYVRDSRISINGGEVSHPIEANIWQMDIEDQVQYLKSIATAGCNRDTPMPEDFTDWIFWKLGERIAEDYMLPYNQKVFNKELDELGTYWLEKLPDVSFEETLRSCLSRKAYGKQPGHAQFYYPQKYGYGELWKRMAENIRENIVYGALVVKLDFENKTAACEDGLFEAETVITTIPWHSIKELAGMPENLLARVRNLKHSSVEVRYFDQNLDTEAQWIYYPDPAIPYHRILVRQNFCKGSRGYWTETNSRRVELFSIEDGSFRYMNEYAYPLNTAEKPETMQELLEFAGGKGVYGLGRWGEHQHYNSDVTVQRAMQLFRDLVPGVGGGNTRNKKFYLIVWNEALGIMGHRMARGTFLTAGCRRRDEDESVGIRWNGNGRIPFYEKISWYRSGCLWNSQKFGVKQNCGRTG